MKSLFHIMKMNNIRKCYFPAKGYITKKFSLFDYSFEIIRNKIPPSKGNNLKIQRNRYYSKLNINKICVTFGK